MHTRLQSWAKLSLGLSIGLSLGFHLSVLAAVDAVLPANPLQSLALQRSLALMSASQDPSGPEVRILFYGQSIVTQGWWQEVSADLRRRFPLAHLVIENRAISSFSANYLLKTAEADVYPFRPDLILCHCYGPYGAGLDWERLWSEFRSRTTADIIMLGNHITNPDEVNELENPALQTPEASQYWINYVFAPELAERFGLCFPDNRSQWRAFLRTHQLAVPDLLEDSVHLNALGNQLQAAILRRYLTGPQLVPPLDPFNNGRVQTIPAGDPRLTWQDGKIRFEFTGHRIDFLSAGGPIPGFQVKVDGQIPNQLPSGQGHGRASGWPEHWWWPALLYVGNQTQVVPEDWTLTVTRNDLNRPHDFSFDVEGSVTGKDGSGTTTQRFVSNSGRVVIDPTDWDFQQLPYAVGVGFQVFWKSEWRALPHVAATPNSAPGAWTLVTGLPDTQHVLELQADSPSPSALGGLRVYHPGGPAAGTEATADQPWVIRRWQSPDQLMWVWPKAANAQPMTASVFNSTWQPLQGATNLHGFTAWQVTPTDAAGFLRLDLP